MEDNKNADALEVLDVAISTALRRLPDVIAAKRKELLALGKGIEKGGVGIKAVGRTVNEFLGEALREIPAEAIKYAGDRDDALTLFRNRLEAFVEGAQISLDRYAYYVLGDSMTSQAKERTRQLLDESRTAVGASITVLRGGPRPVTVGDPAPSNSSARLSSQERDDECRRVAQLLDADGVTIRNVTAARIAALWDPGKGSPLAIGSITMFMSGGAKGRPKKTSA